MSKWWDCVTLFDAEGCVYSAGSKDFESAYCQFLEMTGARNGGCLAYPIVGDYWEPKFHHGDLAVAVKRPWVAGGRLALLKLEDGHFVYRIRRDGDDFHLASGDGAW